MSKKEKSQKSLIENLLEKGVVKFGSDESFSYTRIPFHIPSLDLMVGGGIPKKRISLFTGPSNSGKSYLASQIVASAQKEGGTAAWIDTELSWDKEWMEKCGIDVSSMLVAQPTTGEEAFELVRDLLRVPVDVLVLDSIAGLVPTSVQEENFSYNPIAWQARFINTSLPRIFPDLKNGSALIIINQVRSSIGPVSLDNMPGGMAQVFFSHFILQIRRQGWIKEQEQILGYDMEVRLRKTKAGGEHHSSCVVPFRFQGGLDLVETYIREGLDKEDITQSGPWFKLWNGEKIIGLNGVRKYFKEHLQEFEELKRRVKKNDVLESIEEEV